VFKLSPVPLQKDLQNQVQVASQMLHSVLHPKALARDIRHEDEKILAFPAGVPSKYKHEEQPMEGVLDENVAPDLTFNDIESPLTDLSSEGSACGDEVADLPSEGSAYGDEDAPARPWMEAMKRQKKVMDAVANAYNSCRWKTKILKGLELKLNTNDLG
jgi:hypothetical protein